MVDIDVAKIAELHKKSIIGAVETGQRLIEARESLTYSDFKELEKRIKPTLGARWIAYVELAQHPVWSRNDDLSEVFDNLSRKERKEIGLLMENVLDCILDSMNSQMGLN